MKFELEDMLGTITQSSTKLWTNKGYQYSKITCSDGMPSIARQFYIADTYTQGPVFWTPTITIQFHSHIITAQWFSGFVEIELELLWLHLVFGCLKHQGHKGYVGILTSIV